MATKWAPGITAVAMITPVATRRGSIIHGMNDNAKISQPPVELKTIKPKTTTTKTFLNLLAGALWATEAINGANAVINTIRRRRHPQAHRRTVTTASPSPVARNNCPHPYQSPYRHDGRMATLMMARMTFINGHHDQVALIATIEPALHDYGPSPICTPPDHRTAPIWAIMWTATKSIAKWTVILPYSS